MTEETIDCLMQIISLLVRLGSHFAGTKVLALSTTKKRAALIASTTHSIMISRRSQRIRKPTVIQEAAEAPISYDRKKAIQKASKTVKKKALTPIPIEPISTSIPRELPSYNPPIRISKKRGKPRFKGLSELQTFQKFFTKAIIQLIIIAINSYAARKRSHSDLLHTRTWKDIIIGEIYRYIGVWLYMGMHREAVRATFWSPTHQLGRYLPYHRFEQIHRYFSIRDEATSPRQ